MSPDIMRFGRRAVIDVTANVQIEVFAFDLADRHDAGILLDLQTVAIDVCDLLDVFRSQRVLVLGFPVFPIRIDEQHVFAFAGTGFVDDEHAGRDTRAVEQGWRHPDHRFQNPVLDELLAAFPFFAATKQHTVWHDDGHLPVALE